LGFDERNPERGILSKVQSGVAHTYYHVFITSAPYSSIDPYFPDYCKHYQQQSFLEEGGYRIVTPPLGKIVCRTAGLVQYTKKQQHFICRQT
jgi:hypothetical protein